MCIYVECDLWTAFEAFWYGPNIPSLCHSRKTSSLSLLPLGKYFLELKWFGYLRDEHLYLLHLFILCRALQRSGTSIPECRRLELLNTVAQYCDCSAEDVTDEMIQQASEVNTKYIFHYASTFCTMHVACQNTDIIIFKSLMLEPRVHKNGWVE